MTERLWSLGWHFRSRSGIGKNQCQGDDGIILTMILDGNWGQSVHTDSAPGTRLLYLLQASVKNQVEQFKWHSRSF